MSGKIDLQSNEMSTLLTNADGYGYDVRVLPRRNAMFTSSFTGWTNFMMDFGTMLSDGEAMKRFGNTAVMNNVISDASNIPYTYQQFSHINYMGRAWIIKYGFFYRLFFLRLIAQFFTQI